MGDGGVSGLVQDIINKVTEICEISDYIFIVRKPFLSLSRRLKVSIPFFEEIRDHTKRVSSNLYYSLVSLFHNLEGTKKLLRQGKGSKIYLILEREQIMTEYEVISHKLVQDLRKIYDEDHDISNEVEEHASFILCQFQRAKGKFDLPDDYKLHKDLNIIYEKGTDALVDPSILRELVKTLELTSAAQIEAESQALNKMNTDFARDQGEKMEKMLAVLKVFKDFVQGGNQSWDNSSSESPLVDISVRQGIIETNCNNNKTTPNEFLCPVSLQLMQDPVVIASGQTYERTSIEKWLQAGNECCPKTRQILENKALTPNFTLKSLITQWCEENGITYPRKGVSPTSSNCTPTEYQLINTYIMQLQSNNPRMGAAEISIMSTRSSEVRKAIAEAGAIPLLVSQLKRNASIRELNTQEVAMQALLNLSICDENKSRIVSSGAIPIIIEVMKNTYSSEHGAAVLNSLCTSDDRRSLIGAFGGIEPLVWILSKGSERCRKDAANALYNLCLFPGNKGRALRDGIVRGLMILIREPQGRTKDEALVLLDMIKKHHDAKEALDAEDPIAHLVEIVWKGSRKNQEHAASVLLHLCSEDEKHLKDAQMEGVKQYLVDMKDYGSERGKRKAGKLLELMTTFTGERKRARTEPNAASGSGTNRRRLSRKAPTRFIPNNN